MRKFVTLAWSLLASAAALAATSSVTTPGTFDLYRGTSRLSQHATLPLCEAAARAASQSRAASGTYGCRTIWTVAVTYTPDAPPPVDPPPVVTPPAQSGSASISVSPSSMPYNGYATLQWKCGTGCVKSAVPAETRFSTDTRNDWAISVAPPVTTTYTVTDATGSKSVTLEVTGSAPQDPPPSGGGGSSGGGTTNPPPVTNLPIPDVLATPIALPVLRQIPATSPALKYAETARRNWNFEGHVVPVPFSQDQGYWDYENCTTHYAVWLFDRPGAWFKLAAMTGDASYRDQAVSDFRYWVSKINAQGFFSCKTGEADTKYLELESFLFYEQATGDQSFRPVADRIYAQSAQGLDNVYSPGLALWTEREVGIHLGAAIDYYRLTGNQQALARAAALVRQWTAVAGASGAPQVSYTQHEGGGPGGTQPTSLTNSPWMSAFYFQAARRYWQITGDAEVLRQASRYFDWLTVNGLYDGSLFHPEFAGVTVPRYLTGDLIGDAGYDEGNLLHCPDVQGLVAFAVDAKRRLGEPTAAAEQRLAELEACTARMWTNWTRDGGLSNALPKYRIQAPRAFNWWMRGLFESAR